MEFVVQNGDLVTWTVRVGNTSNFTAAPNTVATLVYPPGLAYNSHYVPQGTFVAGTGVWNVGTVFPQQILQMTITFMVIDITQAPFILNGSVISPGIETTYIDNSTLNTVYALCAVIAGCTNTAPSQYVCEEFNVPFGGTQVVTVNTSLAGYDDTVFRNGEIQETIVDYTNAGNIYTFTKPFGFSTGANNALEKIKICKFK